MAGYDDYGFDEDEETRRRRREEEPPPFMRTDLPGGIERADEPPPPPPPPPPPQENSGGGYIEGVGETIRPGSSMTPAQRDKYLADARANGVPDSFINEFIAQNGGSENFADYHRIQEQWNQRQRGGGGGGGGATAAYQGYLGQSNPALDALLGELRTERERAAKERAEMRQLLMDRIGGASKPVTQDDPGIREILAARRLALRRGTDEGRAQAAEQRAFEGYGANSDVLRSDIERLNEETAERDSSITGEVMYGELNGRRQELLALLNMATNLGDAEAARNLQGQLSLIDQQMSQAKFDADLGFRRSSFLDDLGLRLLMLQMQSNRDSTEGLT